MKQPFRSPNFYDRTSENYNGSYPADNDFQLAVRQSNYFRVNPEGSVNNNIFSYVFLGAILFVAAVAFTMLHLSNISTLQFPYVTAALMLATSSAYLLYQAAKHDKNRLSQL